MIKTIIKELTNEDQSLLGPLLKTKVLASKLKNSNLLNWVNKEINGYNQDEVLPQYRIGKCNTKCTLIKEGYIPQYNIPVPVTLFVDDIARKFFTEFEFRESVKTLESYVQNPKQDSIGKKFSIDFWRDTTSLLNKSGFGGEIRDIEKFTHLSTVTQSLTEIRGKFLDLMLELDDENIELVNDNLEFNPSTIKKLTQIINVYMGNNNDIKNITDSEGAIIGNYNSQNIIKGDNNSLSPENNGVKEEIDNIISKLNESIEKIKISSENQEDIRIEINRINFELQQPRPKTGILKQSFNIILSFLTSIAANQYTTPIVTGIQQLIEKF